MRFLLSYYCLVLREDDELQDEADPDQDNDAEDALVADKWGQR